MTIYVKKYIGTDTQVAQDDAMVFSCALDSLSMEGQIKVDNIGAKYNTLGTNNGVLILKVILIESVLQTNMAIIKCNDNI